MSDAQDRPSRGRRSRLLRSIRIAGMVTGFVLLTSGLFAWDVVGLVLIAGSAGAR